MNSRLFFLLCSFFLFACKESKQKKEIAQIPPQYYYYPRANVYFDSANKDYLFLASDGKTWQTAKQIPAVVQELMDKSVLIQSPSQPVWKDNEKHKLIYSALLYATPNDTVAKKDTPVIIQKKPEAGEAPRVKKRSGIKKFFDKIFGRFKKDKNKKDSGQ